jgi:hypothetical protein
MNDPALILKEIMANYDYRLNRPEFENRARKLLDDFYNDVYEEGFSDGYDNAIGEEEPDDDFGPSGGIEDPEY